MLIPATKHEVDRAVRIVHALPRLRLAVLHATHPTHAPRRRPLVLTDTMRRLRAHGFGGR